MSETRTLTSPEVTSPPAALSTHSALSSTRQTLRERVVKAQPASRRSTSPTSCRFGTGCQMRLVDDTPTAPR